MPENRNESRHSQPNPNATALAAETLRSASQPAAKSDERMSVFWRVFGGTLLSIAALVIITVCQQFNSQLNELRNEQAHLNTDLRKEFSRLTETHADMVKKEDVQTRTRSLWDAVKELQADRNCIAAQKERMALLEQQLKAAEEDRKELAREVQRLREARAAEEGRKELTQELQQLRERLAAVEGRRSASKPDPDGGH